LTKFKLLPPSLFLQFFQASPPKLFSFFDEILLIILEEKDLKKEKNKDDEKSKKEPIRERNPILNGPPLLPLL